MAETVMLNNVYNYIEKQKKFVEQIKSIQYSLINKEYKKQGYNFTNYVKSKWNISKAQAYRYLISAKVIDQLKEFDILPNYERLCRSLNSVTETPQQIKLLWGTIVKKYRYIPDNINSSMISKVWKELCMDKKYFNICHIEKNINEKIERSLDKYSRKIKSKQLNSKANQSTNTIKNNTTSPNTKIEAYNKTSEINYPNVLNNNKKVINNNNNNNNNNSDNKSKGFQSINTSNLPITYLTPTQSPISTNANITTNTITTPTITTPTYTFIPTTGTLTTPTSPINVTFNHCNNYINDHNTNNNTNNTTSFNNQVPSSVSTIISPITVTDNSIPFSNDLLPQNNIQLTTIALTPNEIYYIPTFQPQCIFSNDNNQYQNVIIY
ncbi:hypothetical protein H8356DRAFT_1077779 [Neocallimastix lanati (nom. inval.)]|uniref:Uncharacterized protein n=1 Tax=Neocallimastix californiae TaxID=1754190 RepID=A0A1Y2EM29_9FUNG|nr:hypothetical protein H8356DRAFT_1077779 [Neocallimastix sp. JGI-2020a]ORY72630.1 hypothetical protein LY90DRAFT_637275 [Neocallimastix californiae]|eukprot:ORY72630.1 hypothetical protein LY90DRAFT_637275 [Neocallimastix californiae]